MILDQRLRTFLEVGRTGSFSRAAYHLSFSQSTVSFHIGALEKELGVPLFVRKGRTISLTPEGELLLREGEELERQAMRLQGAFAMHSGLMEKRVRLGSDAITCIFTLPMALAAFRDRYPDAVFSYVHRSQKEILTDVLNGNLDLAMVGHPVRHHDLTVIPCYEDEIVLVAACENGKPARPVKPAALKELPMVLVTGDVGLELLVRRELANVGVPMKDLNIYMEVGGLAIAKSLVMSGLGSAFLPRITVANETRLGVLREVPIEGLSLKRQNLMIHKKDDVRNKIVVAFREFVQKREWE